jgi:LCP family protein required for cell wall assembly
MRIPQWLMLAWVIVITVAAVGSSVLAYVFVRDRAAELDNVAGLPDLPQFGDHAVASAPAAPPSPTPAETAAVTAPDSTPAATLDPAVTPSGDAAASPTAAPQAASGNWNVNDPRRVSVLLMGIDQRQGESGSFPTDTIILFSLDPVGKTAAILSIPRDLQVEYPGLGRAGRINAANILGDEISYPGGGGPMFAVKSVERVLGIKIQYYVLINFEVFYTVVDAVGPIEVCPTETIHDDKYPDGSYGYITVHFDPGCQSLDAEHLLQYARVRHNDSDIGRSSRQQEVILKVRQKMLSTGGIAALLPQAPDLWNAMRDNIKTNLTFEDMLNLARKAEEVPSENIRQGQITFEEVFISKTEDGDDILVPISSDIRLLIEDLFRPAGVPSTRGQ